MTMKILDGPHNPNEYIDPRLLTGQARIDEIGRILALGIIRMYERQHTCQQTACPTPNEPRCSEVSRLSLSPKCRSRKINAKNTKNSLDTLAFRSEYVRRVQQKR